MYWLKNIRHRSLYILIIMYLAKLAQVHVLTFISPNVVYIRMTNDITIEHIKNLNLPQQQSLDFPTVLSAISR